MKNITTGEGSCDGPKRVTGDVGTVCQPWILGLHPFLEQDLTLLLIPSTQREALGKTKTLGLMQLHDSDYILATGDVLFLNFNKVVVNRI